METEAKIIIHDGDAKRTIEFLQERFKETIDSLGLEMEPSGLGEIRVTRNPPSFAVFMEDQGYCNREIYDTYKPCDVLAYVVMAHHRLFSGLMNVNIRDEIKQEVWRI